MLILHYAHRQPADYPMAKFRERAAARGPLWQATPGLVFKAFVVGERGHRAAKANTYESFYLLTRRDIALGPNEDLRERRRSEIAEAEARLARPGTTAALAVLDAMSWRLVRLVLARDAIAAPDAAAFEIAHLARPGWTQITQERT